MLGQGGRKHQGYFYAVGPQVGIEIERKEREGSAIEERSQPHPASQRKKILLLRIFVNFKNKLEQYQF